MTTKLDVFRDELMECLIKSGVRRELGYEASINLLDLFTEHVAEALPDWLQIPA